MKTEWILDIKDSISEPFKKAVQGIERSFAHLENKQKQARFEAGKLGSSIADLRGKINGLKDLRDNAFNKESIRQYNSEIRKLERNLQKLENLPPRGFKDKLLSIGSIIKDNLGFLSVSGAIAGLGILGRKAIDASAEFEKFEAVLTNAFGNRSQAKAGMQMLVDFAAKTPFQVDALAKSYEKLANRGFVASRDQLTAMGAIGGWWQTAFKIICYINTWLLPTQF